MSGATQNIALVGCGGMANWHAQQLQKITGVSVIALVDPDKQHTADFRHRYFNHAAEYESFEHLLNHPRTNLDGVVLVTPHHLHFPQTKLALEKGLHVLVEKPMVTSSPQARELAELVQKTGKLLAIGFQSPYTQEFQCLSRMRADGTLGKISLISGWLSQNWLNWTRNTWRQDPSQSGGGQLYDSGAHVLNAIVWLVDSPVVEVSCMIDRVDSPVDINGVAIMRFENGAMGSVAIGGNGVHWDSMIHVQTDKVLAKTAPHGGWLEMNGIDGRKIYPQIQIDETPAAGTPHLNFIRAIRGEEPLRCPVRYGVLLSNLMDSLYRSAAEKSVVSLPPAH